MVITGQYQIGCMLLGSEHRFILWMSGPGVTITKPVSSSLDRNWFDEIKI